MTQTYDIILTVGTETPTNTGLVFKQNDSGQTLRMTVEDFDTTGTTASLIFRKKDNNVVQANITPAGNVFTYVMRGTELEVVGSVVADIKFYDVENNRISSSTFIINVIPDTINPDGISKSYSDSINESVYRCNQAAKAAEDIVLGAVPLATENILGGVKSGNDVIVGTDGLMTVPELDVLNNNLAKLQTRTTISTLPAPTNEAVYFVTSGDNTFPYQFGFLEIRYGSYTGEFVATYKTTGSDNKVYHNTYLGSTWTGWRSDMLFYTALPQVSSSFNGNTDIVSLVFTMLDNSKLQVYLSSFSTSVYPNAYGLLEISKGTYDFNSIKFSWQVSGTSYYEYHGAVNSSGNFTGWKQIYAG